MDGSSQSNAGSYTVLLSLADIDPKSVDVHIDDGYAPPALSVWLVARNGKKTIREIYGSNRTMKVSITAVGFFADRSSADHVAEAFRRAALLCGNSKHL